MDQLRGFSSDWFVAAIIHEWQTGKETAETAFLVGEIYVQLLVFFTVQTLNKDQLLLTVDLVDVYRWKWQLCNGVIKDDIRIHNEIPRVTIRTPCSRHPNYTTYLHYAGRDGYIEKPLLTICGKSHIIAVERYKMNEYKTIFYETADGRIPAKEFLRSLDYDMWAKMIRTLEMLQKNGPALREPHS